MLRSTLKEHSAIIGTLVINLAATIYAVFNPIVAKELFTLYGLSATGLYGYSQQQRLSDSQPENQDRIKRL